MNIKLFITNNIFLYGSSEQQALNTVEPQETKNLKQRINDNAIAVLFGAGSLAFATGYWIRSKVLGTETVPLNPATPIARQDADNQDQVIGTNQPNSKDRTEPSISPQTTKDTYFSASINETLITKISTIKGQVSTQHSIRNKCSQHLLGVVYAHIDKTNILKLFNTNIKEFLNSLNTLSELQELEGEGLTSATLSEINTKIKKCNADINNIKNSPQLDINEISTYMSARDYNKLTESENKTLENMIDQFKQTAQDQSNKLGKVEKLLIDLKSLLEQQYKIQILYRTYGNTINSAATAVFKSDEEKLYTLQVIDDTLNDLQALNIAISQAETCFHQCKWGTNILIAQSSVQKFNAYIKEYNTVSIPQIKQLSRIDIKQHNNIIIQNINTFIDCINDERKIGSIREIDNSQLMTSTSDRHKFHLLCTEEHNKLTSIKLELEDIIIILHEIKSKITN